MNLTPYGTITYVPKYDICRLSFYLKCCLIGCFDIDHGYNGYGTSGISSSIGRFVFGFGGSGRGRGPPTADVELDDLDAFDRMMTSLVNDKHYALLLFILHSGNDTNDIGSNSNSNNRGGTSSGSSSSSPPFSYHRQMHALSVYHDILLYQNELMNYHHAHFQPISIQQRILYLVYDVFAVDKMIQWGYFIEDNVIVINNNNDNTATSGSSNNNNNNNNNSAMNNRVLQNGELNLFVQMEIPTIGSNHPHHRSRSSRIHKVMVYHPRWMEDYYYIPYDNLFTNNLFVGPLRYPLYNNASSVHHHHHHHHHYHPEDVTSSNGFFVTTDDGMGMLDDDEEEVDRQGGRGDEEDDGDVDDSTTAAATTTTTAPMMIDTYALSPPSSSSSSSSPDTPKSS